MNNLWAAGDNNRDGVLSYDITVEDSYYNKVCPSGEGRTYWGARRGAAWTGGAPGISEITDWEPKQEI